MKPQEVILIDVDGDEKADVPPPKKKLKQARLPFQVISPGQTVVATDTRATATPVAKKRRLTESLEDIPIVKVVKNDHTELKKNICSEETEKLECSKLETEKVLGAEPPSKAEAVRDEKAIVDGKDETKENLANSELISTSVDVPITNSIEPISSTLEAAKHDSDDVDDNEDLNLMLSDDSAEDSDSPDVTESAIVDRNKSSSNLETLQNESQVTPKQKSKKSVSGESSSKRKLTPLQLQKREEREKMKQEKLKQKQEKDDQKKKEKELKEEMKKKEREDKEEQKKKEREEKEEQRKKEKEEKEEQKKKEKEEKEDQRKKEREERERKRLAEMELKNEEKRIKDEEKLLREAAEEEARSKKNKKITSFFTSVAKQPELKPAEVAVAKVVVETQNFHPFQVKSDMRLAPLVRKKFTNRQSMDAALKKQSSRVSYFSEIKKRDILTSGITWPLSEYKDEVLILEPDNKILDTSTNMIVETDSDIVKQPKAKLIQFHENRRPPYWGTWRKMSKYIRPTFPFGKDTKLFDYEVDSDDEWEEEEPGESLHGSDDEKESVDDYEIDNDFFVPHGYLSDEENEGQEEEVMTPETQKAKLKFLEVEFDKEMKHKTERIKPRLIGCIWADLHKNIAGTQLMKMLVSRQAILRDGPIKLLPLKDLSEAVNVIADGAVGTSPPTKTRTKKVKLSEDSIPSLVRLIHGNTNSRAFLIKEFGAYLKINSKKEVSEDGIKPEPVSEVVVSPKSISNKISDLANWMPCLDDGPMSGRMCWYVSAEVRSTYGLADLAVPNAWQYTLQPRRSKELVNSESTSAKSSPQTPKVGSLITNFTKTVTPEERHKQFLLKSAPNATPPSVSKKSLITNFAKVLSQEEKEKQIKDQFAAKAPLPSGEGKASPMAGSSGCKPAAVKKRAQILFSVARGQEIPRSSATNAAAPEQVAKVNGEKPDKSPVVDFLKSGKKEPIVEKMDVEYIDLSD